MNAKVILLMVLTMALIVNADVLQRNYTFTSPVCVNGRIYLLDCENLKSDFNPEMKVKYANLLLPTGHTVESITIDYGAPVTVPGNHFIKPYYPNGRISVEPPAEYTKRKGTAYQQNAFFPSIATRSNTKYGIIHKNGHAILTTMLTPVQYNPVTSQVQYYPNISIKLNTVKTRSAPVYKCNNFIRGWLKMMVDNPEEIEKLPNSPTRATDYEYLIITSAALSDNWGEFIEFNKRRGLRTKVVSVNDITRRANITGRDNPEKIRNYIKDEYEQNNIIFVMLGGDDELVPHRGMHTEFYDYGINHYEDWDIPADLYYSCLDGTWQVSGSQYYGEYGCEDVGWEVYAARFAVDTETELRNMINKTIKYSETPVQSSVTNVLLGGEESWDAYEWDAAQNRYVKAGFKCYGDDCMEELIGECDNNGYTTMSWPESTTFSKLYYRQTPWTGSTMINTVSNNKITFIDHSGHSNTNYILKLSTSEVSTSNFSNNGTSANFFIVYTQGCYPGAFDNSTPSGSQSADCIAEQFTTISTAAVAMISNTRYGLGADGREGSDGNSPYTDGSSQRFQRYFRDGVSRNLPMEMANGYGKEQNSDWICNSDPHGEPYHGQMKYCAYEVNILGDPAMHVWTEEPAELTAGYTTPLNSNTFTWNTEIPFIWVALCDDQGEIITFQMAGDDGRININDQALSDYLSQNPGEDLIVRAKGQNHLPFEGELPVDITAIYQTAHNLQYHAALTPTHKALQLNFKLQSENRVNLIIANAKGATLINNEHQAVKGHNVMSVNTSALSSGVYYCTFRCNDKQITSRFMICR